MARRISRRTGAWIGGALAVVIVATALVSARAGWLVGGQASRSPQAATPGASAIGLPSGGTNDSLSLADVGWAWDTHEIGAAGAEIQDAIVLPDRLVVIGSDDENGMAWVSFDGESWTRARVPRATLEGRAIRSLGPVYEAGYRLVALAWTDRSGWGGPPSAVTSHDGGESWELDDESFWPTEGWDGGGRVADVLAVGERFVAVGHALPAWAIYLPFPRVWTSGDGHHWSTVDVEESLGGGILFGVRIGEGGIHAFGQKTRVTGSSRRMPAVARSEDGVTWSDSMVVSDQPGAVLDVLQLSGGDVVAVGDLGDSPDTLRGAIWREDGAGAWSRELVVDAPSEVRAVRELYDGTLVAFGSADGLPMMWRRSAVGSWHGEPIGDEPAWVRAGLEFRGSLFLIANVQRPSDDESGDFVPDRAIVLRGRPSVDPPPPTAWPVAPEGELVPVPTTEPLPFGGQGACLHARLSARLVRDAEHGFIAQRGSHETVVIWPYGYVARDTSGGRVLVDHIGQVVAREGDYVQLAGGERGDGFVTCGFTPEFAGGIDCPLPSMDCHLALAAARALVPEVSSSRAAVQWGRMLGVWHAEVHVSLDGRGQIIDVIAPLNAERVMLSDVSAAVRAGVDEPTAEPQPGDRITAAGISFVLPPGWTYRSPTFVSHGPGWPVIYFSNQPMHDECTRVGNSETCDGPIDELQADGVLIDWWAFGEYPYPTPRALPSGAPYQVGGWDAVRNETDEERCGLQATDAERIVFRRSDMARDELTICSRTLTPVTRAELEDLLASIRFVVTRSD